MSKFGSENDLKIGRQSNPKLDMIVTFKIDLFSKIPFLLVGKYF